MHVHNTTQHMTTELNANITTLRYILNAYSIWWICVGIWIELLVVLPTVFVIIKDVFLVVMVIVTVLGIVVRVSVVMVTGLVRTGILVSCILIICSYRICCAVQGGPEKLTRVGYVCWFWWWTMFWLCMQELFSALLKQQA